MRRERVEDRRPRQRAPIVSSTSLRSVIFELLEVQRGFAFVAQHFEHGRTAFFGHFHAAILEMHDVHLQRLDLKVPIVAAVWTSQRHSGLLHDLSIL